MLRRTLLFAALLAPLTALGQTISVAPKTSYSVEECDGTASTSLTVNWGMATGTTMPTDGTYRILAATSDICPNDITGTTAKVVASDLAPNTGTDGLLSQRYPAIGDPTLTLTFIKTQVGADCTANPKIWLCVQLLGGTTATTVAAKTGTVALAVEGAPPVPVNVAISPGDSALNVTWADGASNGVTPSGYRITAAPASNCPVPPSTTPPCTLGTVVSTETTGAGTRSVRVRGLTIGTLYGVQVYSRNGSGVESAASSIATGTPIDVFDFWEVYQDMTPDDFEEPGGCVSGSAGLLSLLAVAGLLRAVRRRS